MGVHGQLRTSSHYVSSGLRSLLLSEVETSYALKALKVRNFGLRSVEYTDSIP